MTGQISAKKVGDFGAKSKVAIWRARSMRMGRNELGFHFEAGIVSVESILSEEVQ